MAPSLWRFEMRRSGVIADAGREQPAKAGAGEGVSVDGGCPHGVSSAAPALPVTLGAALPTRWLIEQCWQARVG